MKVYVKENKLYIKSGFWFTHETKEMPEELESKFIPFFNYKIRTAATFRAPEGVTEIRTNINGVFYDDDAGRPAANLFMLFVYQPKKYERIRQALLSIGCKCCLETPPTT